MFDSTWHPRYEVVREPGSNGQPYTLPGAIVHCGPEYIGQKVDCDTNLFPCLFDISKGTKSFNLFNYFCLDVQL